MSAWQFKVKILPACAIIEHHGHMPDNLEVVRFNPSAPLEELERQCDELPMYWHGVNRSDAVQTLMATILPERSSWSSSASMCGEKSKDEIELWHDENMELSEVSLSCSLSEPNAAFVKRVIEIADDFDLRLLAVQSHELFAPSLKSFIKHAKECSAARFVPTGTSLSDLLT